MRIEELEHPDPLKVSARDAAISAHGIQKYGDQPYSYHLTFVVEILYAWGYTDTDLVAAGWLHDTIEDTIMTLKELERRFGPHVATLVFAVTGIGSSRHARTKGTVDKLWMIQAAIPLKVADRMANVLCSIADKRWDLVEKYLQEHPLYEELFEKIEMGATLNKYMTEIVKPLFEQSKETK